MSRQRASEAPPIPEDVEDDEWYRGVLVSAKVAKSTNPAYPDPQLEIVWEGRQGWKPKDWLSLKLGLNASTGAPSRLRQALNALAEHDKGDELWFDPDTLEWGYDLEGDDSTPAYAKLTPGQLLMFKGEIREGKGGKIYKITGYRSAAKAKK